MEIEVQLTHEPIAQQRPPPDATVGAWVEFRGVVRGEEEGQPIAALEYEAYSAMAEREIRRLLTELSADKPCQAARVIHRLAIVPVGEAAIYVGIAGRHRAEAFALLAGFMDRLKQDVPIWKRRSLREVPQPGIPSPPAARQGEAHSASEVLALLRTLYRPLTAERIHLEHAAGRVLREPVRAAEDQPAFDRSSVDGYAIRLDDTAKTFRIVDEIRAGDWKPRSLQPGETVRIATGGALPRDGLQVVMKEDVEVAGSVVTVRRRSDERNIRHRGEDARAGQELVSAGTVLTPGALGLLASVGCVRPIVTRLPRVLHLATGNEIIPPDRTPERGQIRDSNSTLVRAFLGQWGITPMQVRLPEDEARARVEIRNLESNLDQVDLLLFSGGASVGEHDFTRRLLEEAGFTIHVSKTTARPGKPLIVAQRGESLAFGLPGNPLAHFVCLNLYLRAALGAWLVQTVEAPFLTGELASDLATDANARETFWPARWSFGEGVATLTPLRWRSSGDLTALATANALLRVPAGTQRLQRGSRVEFVRTERA